MNELPDVQAAIEAVLKALQDQMYSQNTVKVQRGILNGLMKYMKINGLNNFNEEVCMDFIRS
ncbi:MAG: hypothetical protein KGZ63_02305, partial [Clostridiales bacterium]|nr:hypothetical protein [Clostridiales bacterium]